MAGVIYLDAWRDSKKRASTVIADAVAKHYGMGDESAQEIESFVEDIYALHPPPGKLVVDPVEESDLTETMRKTINAESEKLFQAWRHAYFCVVCEAVGERLRVMGIKP